MSAVYVVVDMNIVGSLSKLQAYSLKNLCGHQQFSTNPNRNPTHLPAVIFYDLEARTSLDLFII